MEKNVNTLFSIFDMQKNFASTSSDFTTKNITSKLIHLLDVFKKYEKELLTYIHNEYSKPYWDTYKTDISTIKKEIKYFIKNIKKFRSPRNPQQKLKKLFDKKLKILYRPHGCCLMLLNDLFPLSKTLIPIIGALACGNTLFIKLPNYENNINKIIKSIIKEVFNDNFAYFINEEISEPDLKHILEFNFDLVFYCGSQSYSKNLIRIFAPRSIKLAFDINNKCPVIVDESADLQNAAKQIVWSKLYNAGQTSFSPYYLAIHESIVKTFLSHLKIEYEKQFPKVHKWKMISKIDTSKNFENIISVLVKSSQKNRIIFGGEMNEKERKIELTLITIDDLKSQFLTQDISSPVLPVVIFNNFSDINGIVRHNDTPSSIYFFSKNKKRIKQILNNLESRYLYINEIKMPYFMKSWYGGIRNSGTDLYGQERSIKLFTYEKIICKHKKKLRDKRFKNFVRKEKSIMKKYSISK